MTTSKTHDEDRFLTLVSEAEGASSGSTHAVLMLNPKTAALLLRYRERWNALNKDKDLIGTLYAIEAFTSLVNYGLTGTETRRSGWMSVKRFEHKKDRTLAATMVVTSNGIHFQAAARGADGYHETPPLRWGELEQVAKGENPFPKR